MDQNEVTRQFLIGNTFRQTTMHARIFCICCTGLCLGKLSCQRPLSFSFIRLRSHFHQNLKSDPLPTKRICLQSHAALAL